MSRLNVILMRLVAVLLSLVLISTAIVSGRYARYTTTASGEDSARVARFLMKGDKTDVEQTMIQSFTLKMEPGQTQRIPVFVNYKSEVALEYTLTVNRPYKDLPLVFSLSEDDTTGASSFTGTIPAGETALFYVYAVWPATACSKEYIGRVDKVEFILNVAQAD